MPVGLRVGRSLFPILVVLGLLGLARWQTVFAQGPAAAIADTQTLDGAALPGGMTLVTGVLVAIFILIVFQEAINGFHDTATAVATVIYSNSMGALPAVIMSAVCNFLGVMIGGTAVAFGLVNLLPVDMVTGIDNLGESSLFLALILTAVIWNFATWWYGIPNSTTHTYIGSILGIGMAHSYLLGRGVMGELNWGQIEKVLAALFLSPVIGFGGAMLVYWIIRAVIRDDRMYRPSEAKVTPPLYVRSLLITGGAGVSLLHGSNDGQKSIGLIFLVMIGLAPGLYGLDHGLHREGYPQVSEAVTLITETAYEFIDNQQVGKEAGEVLAAALDAQKQLASIAQQDKKDPASITPALRSDIVILYRKLSSFTRQANRTGELSAIQRDQLNFAGAIINDVVDDVPIWILVVSASALGIGTAIGYKRIVVTLGEKIGKVRMNAAQGTTAQITTVACIGIADATGAPVSTTHVLSSGVAGAMVASKGGLQVSTLSKILLTWVTTLPGTMALSFGMGLLFHTLLAQ